MAILSTYGDDTATSDSDKYLTVDSSGATKLTPALTLKNYVLVAGVITNAMLSTAAGQPGGAWSTYTPTWSGTGSNPAIGNGSIAGRYTQIGKTVTLNIVLSMGSTTTYGAGEWNFTLPVAPKTTSKYVTGTMWAIDTGINYYSGVCKITTSAALISMHGSAAAGSGWGTTSPFTWGSTDELALTITYEAA